MPKDLFVLIIDKIVECIKGNKENYKLLINTLSGLFGKDKTNKCCCNIESDIEQIFHYIKKYEQHCKKIFVDKIADTKHFLYGYNNNQSLWRIIWVCIYRF